MALRTGVRTSPMMSRTDCGPWTVDHLVRLLVTNAIGLAFVVAGSYQSWQQTSPRGGLTWLNVAIAGLILAGGANALWLLRGRQAIAVGQVQVLATPRVFDALAGTVQVSQHHLALVTAPTMTRYHRSDCLLVAGKPHQAGTRAKHELAGRVACEVCEP